MVGRAVPSAPCRVNVRPRSGQTAAACRSCHSVSSLQTSLRLSRVDKKLRSACHASAFVTGCGQGLSYGAESCAPHSWHSAHSAAGSVLDELWRCCGAHWAHGRLVRAEGGFLSPSELDSLRLHSVATRRSLPYLRLGAPDANRAASASLSSLIRPRLVGSLVHRRARVRHVLPGQSPASRHSVKPFRRASYKLIRLKSRQGERTSSPAHANRRTLEEPPSWQRLFRMVLLLRLRMSTSLPGHASLLKHKPTTTKCIVDRAAICVNAGCRPTISICYRYIRHYTDDTMLHLGKPCTSTLFAVSRTSVTSLLNRGSPVADNETQVVPSFAVK